MVVVRISLLSLRGSLYLLFVFGQRFVKVVYEKNYRIRKRLLKTRLFNQTPLNSFHRYVLWMAYTGKVKGVSERDRLINWTLRYFTLAKGKLFLTQYLTLTEPLIDLVLV